MAGATSRTHIGDIMKSLHWLPIAYQIQFKLCVLMHSVDNRTSPSYLMETTTSTSSLPGHRRLPSIMTTKYDISHTRTKFGDRAFSVAVSREWNALPIDIRNISDLSFFKRAIKTLFCIGIFG